MTEDEASSVAGIVYLISGIASPILGLLIDKIGRNIIFILVAIVFTIVSHSIITFTSVDPYVGLVSSLFLYKTV